MWKLADGTVVELGGSVEGASLLALQLRGLIEAGPGITWANGQDYWVDVNDLAQMDAFVREHAANARVAVLSGPKDVPELPPPLPLPGDEDLPEGDDLGPDAVY